MKKSKTNQCNGLFGLYQAQKYGTKFKPGAKDGSIPTHPVVPCDDVLEDAVSKDVSDWLKAHRVVFWRSNVGTMVSPDGKRRHRYGVLGAGDFCGILSSGIYFEIECKRGRGGHWRESQQDHAKLVLTTPAIYVIVHSVEELELKFKGKL